MEVVVVVGTPLRLKFGAFETLFCFWEGAQGEIVFLMGDSISCQGYLGRNNYFDLNNDDIRLKLVNVSRWLVDNSLIG